MTAASNDDPTAPTTPARRFFSDEQKLAIALESEQLGATVSGVARKHGIVTGLLFRWRVQFGVAQKKRAKLVPVALADNIAAARVLRDLVQPPDGMMTVDLPDGRRVFATAGSHPDAFEVSDQHLDLLPAMTRTLVGRRVCQASGNVTRIFVEITRHFTLRRVRTALRLEGAALAIRLA